MIAEHQTTTCEIRAPTDFSALSTVISGGGVTVMSASTAGNGSIRSGEIIQEPLAGGGAFAQSEQKIVETEIVVKEEIKVVETIVETEFDVTERTVAERSLDALQITPPDVMICERVVEVPYKHEQ